jgi:aspartate racemase
MTSKESAHIGLVGCSPPGAALCYQVICVTAGELGRRVEVSVHAHPFADYVARINAGNWASVADLMISSAEKLAVVGAELLIAPCNTIHAVFDVVEARSPLPWLHIADAVAAKARQGGHRRIGLLGTKSIMDGPIYRDRLHTGGIECVTPHRDDCERLDQIIFDELVRGRVVPASRAYLASVITQLRHRGCDAIGLCCTELPMIVDSEISTLPVLDSTALLASAALSTAWIDVDRPSSRYK